MSQNLNKYQIEYIVKVGSRATLTANIKDVNGNVLDLTDAVKYATGRWKVWKPDGTLLINGAIIFANRSQGIVTYALSATDTVLANAGNWAGEIEFLDNVPLVSVQSETFSFVMKVSY